MSYLIFLSLLLTLPNFILCQNWLIKDLLPSDYDGTKVPFPVSTNQSRLPVNISINIASFTVNEGESVDLTWDMCLKWYDYRILDYDNQEQQQPEVANKSDIVVQLSQYGSLWVPKVFFPNAKTSSVVNNFEPNQFVLIYPNRKLVKHCSKMKTTYYCDLSFSYFPFDDNKCDFEIEDFKKQIQRLSLQIEQFEAPTSNAKFRLRDYWISQCSAQVDQQYLSMFKVNLNNSKSDLTNRSNHSCVTFTIRLVRHVNFYIIRHYLLVFLMVIISFMAFWMPTNAFPARIYVNCNVLFTFITQSQSAYDEIPSRDVIALYWFYWGGQFFLYMALCQYGLALAWTWFMQDKHHAREMKRESPDGYYFGKKGWYAASGRGLTSCLQCIFGPIDFHATPATRNKVDYFCRLFFPGMWFLFCLIYLLATVPGWSERYKWR